MGLALALFLFPTLLGAQEKIDLDEVMCAVCHFEQAEEFAESVHYNKGQILCNDCHGGLPFEADAELAKAEGTGFIGKPERGQIARICGQCHSAPVGFFAQGPHYEWTNEANPTCITCHHNHRVLDATLALLENTCTQCHAGEPAALARGAQIGALIEGQQREIGDLRRALDSLAAEHPVLSRARPYLGAAESTLRGAEAATHALQVELIEEKVRAAEADLRPARALLQEHGESQRLRRWALVGVWVLVLGNVLLLWVRRRQLERENPQRPSTHA